MNVGFIGLGTMGRPMALNLLRAGHEMAVFARRPEAAAPLVAAGAVACASAREVAARSAVVFTAVTSSEDVRQVALGPEGIVDGAALGTVVVDHSTIAPSVAREVAARLGERGVFMLDAPVSGGEQGAIDATLAIMVGGRAEALEWVRPLLQCLGRTIVHVGDSGAGQVAKACNQLVMVSAIEACAEAMRLAAASGVDAAKVREALAAGSAGSRVLEVFGARMVARDFRAGGVDPHAARPPEGAAPGLGRPGAGGVAPHAALPPEGAAPGLGRPGAGGVAPHAALPHEGAAPGLGRPGARVQARLHHKDFGLALGEAANLGVPLPVAAQVWQQLNALMAAGWGREDTASLLRVLEADRNA